MCVSHLLLHLPKGRHPSSADSQGKAGNKRDLALAALIVQTAQMVQAVIKNKEFYLAIFCGKRLHETRMHARLALVSVVGKQSSKKEVSPSY